MVISGIDGGDSDDFVGGDDGFYSMLAKNMAILGGMLQQKLSTILLQFNLGDYWLFRLPYIQDLCSLLSLSACLVDFCGLVEF